MGRALWMVSVGMGGVPRGQWSTDQQRLAARVIDKVLEGVGEGKTLPEAGIYAQLARRQCTDAERRTVLEKFLRVR